MAKRTEKKAAAKALSDAAKPTNLISVWFGRVQESARLMCGLPDYDTYVAHMQATHPDQQAMTYEVFFENRMNARFNHSGAKACC